MSDPRNTVVVDDLGAYEPITLLIDNSTIVYDATKARGCVGVDLAVTLSTHKTAALTADGDAVIGKLMAVFSDNTCAVRRTGVFTLPGGNGASLTVGKAIVGALGAASAKGYIREVATGTAAELGKCRSIILDSGTTTAVAVDFG